MDQAELKQVLSATAEVRGGDLNNTVNRPKLVKAILAIAKALDETTERTPNERKFNERQAVNACIELAINFGGALLDIRDSLARIADAAANLDEKGVKTYAQHII